MGHVLFTMTAAHLAYPHLALDIFSGTDHDQDAESLIQLIERKTKYYSWKCTSKPRCFG